MYTPEEDAFSIFCELMLNRNYGLRDLYKPGLSKLELNMYLLEGFLHDLAPELLQHFRAHGLAISSFASPWFLTLFTTTFSTKVASRILDCLLLEGPDIVFKVGLTILLGEKDKLQNLDMEGMLNYLSKEARELYDQDPDLLIQKARSKQFQINERRRKKLEKEFKEKKVKEHEEQIEVSRLRAENQGLRERITALENENENLVKEIAKDRVNHALQLEEKLMMEKELGLIRRNNWNGLDKTF